MADNGPAAGYSRRISQGQLCESISEGQRESQRTESAAHIPDAGIRLRSGKGKRRHDDVPSEKRCSTFLQTLRGQNYHRADGKRALCRRSPERYSQNHFEDGIPAGEPVITAAAASISL